ncbi:MAG: ComEA family DNA-binding protein [Actinomycetes bacterium]
MNQLLQGYKEQIQDWLSDLHFESAQKRALLILALIAVVVSAGVVFRGHSQPVEIALPAPSAPSTLSMIAPPLVTVDVAGGVNTPGVYELPVSSRVIDAITAAGGVKKGSDVSDVNLARIIKDGEQIYVQPIASNSVGTSSTTRVVIKHTGPININRATISEFDSLPGVGPVIAARIVAYRKVNGPFMSVDDLQKVSGIGASKFAEFKSKITV